MWRPRCRGRVEDGWRSCGVGIPAAGVERWRPDPYLRAEPTPRTSSHDPASREANTVSAAARAAAIQSIAKKSPVVFTNGQSKLPELFGANVFGLPQMRARLPEQAYRALQSCMEHGQELDPALA